MKKISTKTKLLLLVLLLGVIIGVVLLGRKIQPETVQGAKAVTVIVEDRSDASVETLLEETWHTDAQLLGQLIDEHTDTLKPELSEADPSWGRSINGLMGLATSDWVTGPWWLYTVNEDYADAIDLCAINDGDTVRFYFTSTY